MTRSALIPETMTLFVPFGIVKRGGRKDMGLPDRVRLERAQDNTLLKALARAFPWKRMNGNGVLSEAQVMQAADKRDPLWRLVETVTKGPELPLPTGYSFRDKDGTERREVRLQWWRAGASSWADLAMCVPDPCELPVTAPPAVVMATTYPKDAKPVFFGHYWLTGAPVLQAPNALCLDYSAGGDGPLIAYRLEDLAAPLSLTTVIGAEAALQPFVNRMEEHSIVDSAQPRPDRDLPRPKALIPTAPRMITPTSTSRT